MEVGPPASTDEKKTTSLSRDQVQIEIHLVKFFVSAIPMVVTIATPVYKVERFIERCARSLFEQSYPDIEFIFVDDCSPDRSMVILKNTIAEYPERQPHIRVIRHDTNRGLGAARNTAISHASGEFVFHVDSDDFIEKNAIALLVEKHLENRADIVSADAIKHTSDGEIDCVEPDYANKEEMLHFLAGNMSHHMIWGRLIRKSLYTENSIQVEEGVNVGEDWQVLVPLVHQAQSIAALHEKIYHYNCVNLDSYMAQKSGTFTLNEPILRQDIRSLEIVKDRFSEISQALYGEIKQTGADYVHALMDKCIVTRNFSFFQELQAFLKRDKDSYDRKLGTRFIDSHFLAYTIHYYGRRLADLIKHDFFF